MGVLPGPSTWINLLFSAPPAVSPVWLWSCGRQPNRTFSYTQDTCLSPAQPSILPPTCRQLTPSLILHLRELHSCYCDCRTTINHSGSPESFPALKFINFRCKTHFILYPASTVSSNLQTLVGERAQRSKPKPGPAKEKPGGPHTSCSQGFSLIPQVSHRVQWSQAFIRCKIQPFYPS